MLGRRPVFVKNSSANLCLFKKHDLKNIVLIVFSNVRGVQMIKIKSCHLRTYRVEGLMLD